WKDASARRDLPTEVFLGFAGFVHAARDFDVHAVHLGPRMAERLRSVGHEAHARVTASLSRIARKPLRRGTPIGYAHGRAGELGAVLAWVPHPAPMVAAVLDRLLAQAVIEDQLVTWPAEVGGDACGPWWATWCNGVAGHVYLWCRAFEVFRDERYRTA